MNSSIVLEATPTDRLPKDIDDKKAPPPKSTPSDGVAYTKVSCQPTSDMSMVQETNPPVKVTHNKSANTPRDPKEGDDITQSGSTSDTGDTPSKDILCDKCSHTFFTFGALKVHNEHAHKLPINTRKLRI